MAGELVASGERAVALGGLVDSLLQTFENSRSGLGDDLLAEGTTAVERFYRDLYDREADRVAEAVKLVEPMVDAAGSAELTQAIDRYVRKVLVPGYSRLALQMTRRERNGFFAAPDPWHGLERAGLAVLGLLVGAFVVWAPFIPIWSKEAVAPFALGGLLFPELRRFLAYRRYAREVNRLALSVDAEVERLSSERLLREGCDEVVRLPAHDEGGANG